MILHNRAKLRLSGDSTGFLEDLSDRIQSRLHQRLVALRDSLGHGLLSQREFQRILRRLQERAHARLDSATVRIHARIQERLEDVAGRYRRCRAAVWDSMVSTLDLTQDQEDSLHRIEERFQAELERLRVRVRSGDLTRVAYARALLGLRSGVFDAISAVFTDSQLEIAKIHLALVLRFHRFGGGDRNSNIAAVRLTLEDS